MTTKKQLPLPSFLLIVGLSASPMAWAVDGVLEINQACAVNTGCFAGDTAGFPVIIASGPLHRRDSWRRESIIC